MEKFLVKLKSTPSTSAEGSEKKNEKLPAKKEMGPESKNDDFPASDESK